jgi:hypothetical protein
MILVIPPAQRKFYATMLALQQREYDRSVVERARREEIDASNRLHGVMYAAPEPGTWKYEAERDTWAMDIEQKWLWRGEGNWRQVDWARRRNIAKE